MHDSRCKGLYKYGGSIPRNARGLRNIAMCDYQESVTTGQMDRQTPDKVIPMCRYASQAKTKIPRF